jgi:DNA-binding NtrC family response regulator
LRSHRNAQRFVPVNCSNLSGDPHENTLLGHVSGAFTGARALSEGLVIEAEGGTLFLDEVDSLSGPCQTKLLRFLQDQKYRRLGEGRLRQADVRVIAATNTDLESAVSEGRFRKDLFFRLRVFPVEIAALSRRSEDIPELIAVFKARSAAKYELPPVELSSGIVECMQRYEWPGNIRELENCVAYLTCLQLGRPIEPRDLPFLSQFRDANPENVEQSAVHDGGLQDSKNRLVAQFERQYIERALRTTNGNVSAAARISGKNRRALFELMRKHEIRPDDFRAA